jgi:hypothetical protein
MRYVLEPAFTPSGIPADVPCEATLVTLESTPGVLEFLEERW